MEEHQAAELERSIHHLKTAMALLQREQNTINAYVAELKISSRSAAQ